MTERDRTIAIKRTIHKQVKDYCLEKGLKMNVLTERLLLAEINKQERNGNRD